MAVLAVISFLPSYTDNFCALPHSLLLDTLEFVSRDYYHAPMQCIWDTYLVFSVLPSYHLPLQNGDNSSPYALQPVYQDTHSSQMDLPLVLYPCTAGTEIGQLRISTQVTDWIEWELLTSVEARWDFFCMF